MLTLRTCTVLVALLLATAARAVERTWTSDTGKHQVRAELMRFDGKMVTLRRADGKTITVPMDRFSEADREYVASQSDQADASPRILVLENVYEELDRFGPVVNMKVPGELVRQTILMVARDDFGLATRDATLRESSIHDGADVIRLRILVAPGQDDLLRVRLWVIPSRVGRSADPALVWSEDYSYNLGAREMYYAVLYHVLTDARGDISQVLTRLGGEKRIAGPRKSVQPMERANHLLDRVDMVSQYEAVRAAHDSIGRDGENFENLSVLVRGYANLSLMTVHFWNSASTAFLARSLLYGEKLEHASEDQDRINASRAYSMAVFGQHQMALDQLDHMSRESTKRTFPAWFALVRPYCEYDVDALRELAAQNHDVTSLAAWLEFRVAVDSSDAPNASKTGRRALKECPDLFQVYADLYSMTAMGTRRELANVGPVQFRRYAAERVGEVKGLPKASQDVIDQLDQSDHKSNRDLYAIPGRIAKALIADSRTDRAEPSWEVLGRMIEDEMLVLMATQLHDASNAVTMSLKPMVDQMRPHLVDHPYASYIESFGVDREADPKTFLGILDGIPRIDPQLHMTLFYKRLWNVNTSRTKDVGQYFRSQANTEFTSHSLGRRMESGFPNREAQIYFANLFAQVSPHSPLAQRLRIASAGDATPEQLAEWSEAAPEDPHIQDLVARAFQRRGMIEEAKQAYERAARLSPDCQRYITLANLYRQSGDRAGWKETLEAYLKVPDDGLGHHRIHRAIAEGFMAEQKWEEAKPHATAAAESWSSWGLRVGSECYEGLGDWSKSEQYARQNSQSYQGDPRSAWYFWCKRTGRGDVKAARNVAQPFIHAPRDPDNLHHIDRLAAYYRLEDDLPQAMTTYQTGIQAYPSLWWDMHLGILAKRTNNKEILAVVSARLDKRARSKGLARSEFRMQLADVARRVLAPKGNESVDLDEINQLMNEWRSGDMHVDLRYFLGEFLMELGHKKQAADYWRDAVTAGPFDRVACTLAGHQLVQQQGTSRK